MKIFIRILLTFAALLLLFVGSLAVLPLYDRHTTRQLLGAAARELPPGASMTQMDRFMRRHTEAYDFTNGEVYGHPEDEYGGRQAQTKIDKFFFDRKVLIHLKVDRRTRTFKSADVYIAYTFL